MIQRIGHKGKRDQRQHIDGNACQLIVPFEDTGNHHRQGQCQYIDAKSTYTGQSFRTGTSHQDQCQRNQIGSLGGSQQIHMIDYSKPSEKTSDQSHVQMYMSFCFFVHLPNSSKKNC